MVPIILIVRHGKTEDDELPLKNGRKIVYGFTH